jgi:hypothetical protein
VLAGEGRWDEVPGFLDRTREFADRGELRALTVHLDRLEGRAAIVAGDHARGLELLQRAGHSFADLGAAWERARTELDVAEVLTAAARADEARSMLDTATPDIERAGALIELDRLRSLRAGLV